MPIRVGTLEVTLLLEEGASLKDKRRVVKGLIETTRRKFNVAVSEIDDLDLWRRATLGIVTVSNSGTFCNKVLDTVLDHLESYPEFEVASVSMDID